MTAELVEQTFVHSELWHRAVTVTLDGRAAINRVIVLNWKTAALDAGFPPLPQDLEVVWGPLTDIELVEASTVSVVDGRPDEPAFYDASFEDIAVEEASRRVWWEGIERGTVSGVVLALAERPGLRGLSVAQFDRLREEGQQVLVEQRASTAVCGGVLRRHSFPPREAELMRDGMLVASTCNDCQQAVTRAALLLRAAQEKQNGTCPLDGDALRPGGDCPSCFERLTGHYAR